MWFCDLGHRGEFRLATNLRQLTNEEISKTYGNRWQIEISWKFLKMHCSLDSLISKDINEVTIQIYMVLVAYLILQLMKISVFYRQRLLDKFRYWQLEPSRRCSIVHRSYNLLPAALVH